MDAYKIRRSEDGFYLANTGSPGIKNWTKYGGRTFGSLTALAAYLRRFGLPAGAEVAAFQAVPLPADEQVTISLVLLGRRPRSK